MDMIIEEAAIVRRNATTKSAVYDFKASYVRAVADQTATAGYVKTNTAYTITYQ